MYAYISVANSCSCRHAFNAESLFALLFQIMNGKYEPIPEDRYSADLAGLLALLLQQDYEQRPSCKALLKHPYVLKHIEYTMHKVWAPCMLRGPVHGKSILVQLARNQPNAVTVVHIVSMGSGM